MAATSLVKDELQSDQVQIPIAAPLGTGWARYPVSDDQHPS